MSVYALHVFSAFIIGATAGLTPGPLSVYILSEVMAGRYLHGIAAAFSPVISDGPIACTAILVLSVLPYQETVYTFLYAAGGIYLVFLAYKVAAARPNEGRVAAGSVSLSLLKGVGINLLNPNPYIFWMTVGGPLVVKYASRSPWSAAAFLLLFYTGLVGSKCLTALSGMWGRKGGGVRLASVVQRALSVVLSLYALYFFYQAYKMYTP